jgi:protein phosphatase
MAEETEITARFAREELQAGWNERGTPARHFARLLLGAKTDLGCVRENNEDKFEFYIPSDARVLAWRGIALAVSDGMGGHAAGQIASELALKTFIESYYSALTAPVETALRDAVAAANQAVHTAASVAGREGMGCTLTAAAVRGNELFVAHVGDSRLYLLREGQLRQLTDDHSWVGEQVRRGALTEEEAELSPFRNVITRAIGTAPSVEPDILREELQSGDTLLLCSDGLSGVVRSEQIEAVLNQSGPSEACVRLIRMALEAGGPDNVTALVAKVESIEPLPDDALEEVEEVSGAPEDASGQPAAEEEREAPKRRRGLLGSLLHRD